GGEASCAHSAISSIDCRAPFEARVLAPQDAGNALTVDGASLLREVEREGRDLDVERLAGFGDHSVAPDHEAGRRGQWNSARVLVILARLQHRLLADHPRAAHLLQAAIGVGDAPVAGLVAGPPPSRSWVRGTL